VASHRVPIPRVLIVRNFEQFVKKPHRGRPNDGRSKRRISGTVSRLVRVMDWHWTEMGCGEEGKTLHMERR